MIRAHSTYCSTICLLLLLLSSASYGQTPYSWLALPRITLSNLKSVCFVDSATGWVGGKNGVVFKTTDGGSSWTQQTSGTTAEIVDINMLNKNLGWMVAMQILTQPGGWYGSYLLKTTNGGTTWQSDEFAYLIFYTVTFLDSMNGWFGGDQGLLLGTTNSGNSWFEARVEGSLGSLLPVKKIKFWSPDFGIAVGGISEFAGFIRRTSNYGSAWSIIQGGSDEINDFWFIDSLNIVGVGGGLDEGSMIMKSTDGGLSFTTMFPGTFGVARGLSFRNTSEAYATLNNVRKYIYSSDTGSTWIGYSTPGNINVSDITFTDARHGYMVGDTGSIFKYNPARLLSVQQQWNIVSIPVSSPVRTKTELFPSATSDAFEFTENGYTPSDSLLPGQGYWIKFPAEETIELAGFPIESDTIELREGWNMIGSITEPVLISSVTSDPPELGLSSFFGYDNGYFTAETLLPGRGYWVKAETAGSLYLHSTSSTNVSSIKKPRNK